MPATLSTYMRIADHLVNLHIYHHVGHLVNLHVHHNVGHLVGHGHLVNLHVIKLNDHLGNLNIHHQHDTTTSVSGEVKKILQSCTVMR